MTRELRKDITILLKNKYSITGVIKYLLNKNIEPNEIILHMQIYVLIVIFYNIYKMHKKITYFCTHWQA